jgi:hypothetical protein
MATAGIAMGYVQLALICVGALCFAAYMLFVFGALGSQSH